MRFRYEPCPECSETIVFDTEEDTEETSPVEMCDHCGALVTMDEAIYAKQEETE